VGEVGGRVDERAVEVDGEQPNGGFEASSQSNEDCIRSAKIREQLVS
jgi:hypothetical protein